MILPIKQNMAIEKEIAISKLKINENLQLEYEAENVINDITSKKIQKITTEVKRKLKDLQILKRKLKENNILHIKVDKGNGVVLIEKIETKPTILLIKINLHL